MDSDYTIIIILEVVKGKANWPHLKNWAWATKIYSSSLTENSSENEGSSWNNLTLVK